MEIQEILENLGILPRESRVYLAALELGESLPKNLAAKAEVKRTTLYEMLPNLISKGLLTQSIKGKRKYLVPEDPQKLVIRKRNETAFLEQAKPELLAVYNRTKEKPKVYFFEGLEGIKRVYEDILEDKRNVRAFVGTDNIDEKLLRYLLEDYEPRRIQNQIFVRNLTNEDINIAKIMPASKKLLQENRIISRQKYPISIEIVIYGDKVGYLTIRKTSKSIALLVENKEIADSMKSIFELCWRAAKKD